jgi:preprotein translocase subunit SecD
VAILTVIVAPLGLRDGTAPGPASGSGPASAIPSQQSQIVKLTYGIDPVGGRLPTKAEESRMIDVIGARLNAAGVGNFTIAAGDSIQITIFGPVDVTAVESLLGAAGALEIVALPPETYGKVDTGGAVTVGPKPLPALGDPIDPTLSVQFTGNDLDRSKVAAASDGITQGWVVGLAFTPAATLGFATWTGAHVGEYFAIVLDGKVVEVPYVVQPITSGIAQIGGSFTQASAEGLATVLRNGQMQFPLRLISSVIAIPPASGPPSVAAVPALDSMTPSPTQTPAAGGTFVTYLVRADDTASAIAVGFGMSLETLMAANPQIVNWDNLTLGEALNIPWPGWTPPAPTSSPSPAG